MMMMFDHTSHPPPSPYIPNVERIHIIKELGNDYNFEPFVELIFQSDDVVLSF